jgi:hypothetical protein
MTTTKTKTSSSSISTTTTTTMTDRQTCVEPETYATEKVDLRVCHTI